MHLSLNFPLRDYTLYAVATQVLMLGLKRNLFCQACILCCYPRQSFTAARGGGGRGVSTDLCTILTAPILIWLFLYFRIDSYIAPVTLYATHLVYVKIGF
jgi:hypothetical protein